MDKLKKFFPLSWKYTKNTSDLIIGILIHIVAGIVVGALIKLATMITGWIPVLGALIGWLLGIVSSLLGLYVLAGIVLQILVFTKILKA